MWCVRVTLPPGMIIIILVVIPTRLVRKKPTVKPNTYTQKQHGPQTTLCECDGVKIVSSIIHCLTIENDTTVLYTKLYARKHRIAKLHKRLTWCNFRWNSWRIRFAFKFRRVVRYSFRDPPAGAAAPQTFNAETWVRKCAVAVMPAEGWIEMRLHTYLGADFPFRIGEGGKGGAGGAELVEFGGMGSVEVACSWCIMNTICKHTRTWVRISWTNNTTQRQSERMDGFPLVISRKNPTQAERWLYARATLFVSCLQAQRVVHTMCAMGAWPYTHIQTNPQLCCFYVCGA